MKVQVKQYAKLLLEMTENLKKQEEIDAQIKKLAEIVKENKDQAKMDKIIDEYSRLYKEHHGLVEGDVISARELTKKELDEVKALVAKKYKTAQDKVSMTAKVDESIKGGLIIKVGNEIWDGSVKSKLERLKQSIS